MAYVVICHKGQEVDRFELIAPLTIGRAIDCDFHVRDIELSRHHCRLEPTGNDEWAIVDLNSKNGTIIDGHRIQRQILKDEDAIRIGRTRIKFHVGEFDGSARKPAPKRAADPTEALAGTVSGFEYTEPPTPEPGVDDMPIGKPLPANAPRPKPKPAEATSNGADDEAYAALSEIASSSWDSIYAGAVEKPRPDADVPERLTPRPNRSHVRRRESPVDLTLQAMPAQDSLDTAAPPQKRSFWRRLWNRLLGRG